ncbi:MAG: phosphate-starvation-inducible PsiE family protein [Thiolinea sp.]
MLRKYTPFVEKVGNTAVEVFHLLGLFVIGGTIVWAAIYEYLIIMQKPHATLSDILLLFIYLELGAMIGIFFRTKRLPVIFLIFIAMTALTRYLAIDLKHFDDLKMMTVVGSIFILSLAALILRYSECRFKASEEGLGTRLPIKNEANQE